MAFVPSPLQCMMEEKEERCPTSAGTTTRNRKQNPPRLPGRQKSWQSSNSRQQQSNIHHQQQHQNLTVKSPIRRRRSDLMPKLPWRHHQHQGGGIDCITEVDHEIDMSTSFHASCSNLNEDFQQVFPRGLGNDVVVSPGAAVVDKPVPNHERRKSAPVLPARSNSSSVDTEEKSSGAVDQNEAHPLDQNSTGSKSSGKNNNSSHGNSNSSSNCRKQELNFPVRRESVQTVATLQSSSKLTTAVPMSVSPDATPMEKKSLLKRTLHFPKQRLNHVLKRVVTSTTTTATIVTTTAGAQKDVSPVAGGVSQEQNN